MQNTEKMSVGQLSRELIKYFKFYVDTFSMTEEENKQVPNYEESLPPWRYHLSKSFIDHLLNAEDIAQIIKLDYKRAISDNTSQQKGQELYSDEVEWIPLSKKILARKVLATSDNIFIEALEKSRPILEQLVEKYEIARGWK